MIIDNLIKANFLSIEDVERNGALVVSTVCSCTENDPFNFGLQYVKDIAKVIAKQAKSHKVDRVIMMGGCAAYDIKFGIAPFKRALAELKIDSAWLDYGEVDTPNCRRSNAVLAINNVLFDGKQVFRLDLSANWENIKVQEATCSSLFRSVQKKLEISKLIEEERELLVEYPFVFPADEVSRHNSERTTQLFKVKNSEISPNKFTALFQNDWKSGVLVGKTTKFYFDLKLDEEQVARKITDIFSRDRVEVELPISLNHTSETICLKIKSGNYKVEEHHALDFLSNPGEEFSPLHLRVYK